MSEPRQMQRLWTWFTKGWTTQLVHERNARVFTVIPYPMEVDGYEVEEWHQQRADCFVGHMVDDLTIEGVQIADDAVREGIAQRVADLIASSCALDRARKDGKWKA